MKLFGVVFAEIDADRVGAPYVAANGYEMAMKGLPLGRLLVSKTYEEAKGLFQDGQEGFIYELNTHDKQDHEESGESLQPRDIRYIQNVWFYNSSPKTKTKEISLSAVDNQILPKKLVLFGRLRELSLFAYNHAPQPKGPQELFDSEHLFGCVDALERNAANSLKDQEYLDTLDRLNKALFSLILRVGIDNNGQFKESPNTDEGYQKGRHEIFKQQIHDLGFMNSNCRLHLKLGTAFLAISLAFATTPLLGLAPLGGAAVATVASLAMSLRFFHHVRHDQGVQCELALVNFPSKACGSVFGRC